MPDAQLALELDRALAGDEVGAEARELASLLVAATGPARFDVSAGEVERTLAHVRRARRSRSPLRLGLALAAALVLAAVAVVTLRTPGEDVQARAATAADRAFYLVEEIRPRRRGLFEPTISSGYVDPQRGRGHWTVSTLAGQVVAETAIDGRRVIRYEAASNTITVAGSCHAFATGCAEVLDPFELYRRALDSDATQIERVDGDWRITLHGVRVDQVALVDGTTFLPRRIEWRDAGRTVSVVRFRTVRPQGVDKALLELEPHPGARVRHVTASGIPVRQLSEHAIEPPRGAVWLGPTYLGAPAQAAEVRFTTGTAIRVTYGPIRVWTFDATVPPEVVAGRLGSVKPIVFPGGVARIYFDQSGGDGRGTALRLAERGRDLGILQGSSISSRPHARSGGCHEAHRRYRRDPRQRGGRGRGRKAAGRPRARVLVRQHAARLVRPCDAASGLAPLGADRLPRVRLGALRRPDAPRLVVVRRRLEAAEPPFREHAGASATRRSLVAHAGLCSGARLAPARPAARRREPGRGRCPPARDRPAEAQAPPARGAGKQVWWFARLNDRAAFLLVPEGRFGAAEVGVVDADGEVRRTTIDGISVGSIVDESGNEPSSSQRGAGFAVDPVARAGYVVGADLLVARVDLDSLALTYHRPVLRATQKSIEGPQRSAIWLGNGLLAVSGVDYATGKDATGKPVTTSTPFGLRLVDTGDWTVRTVDLEANWVRLAGDTMLAQRDGPVTIAYGLDGRERWRTTIPQYSWLDARGDYAYVCDNGYLRRVLDVRTGTTTASFPHRSNRRCAPLLTR